MGRKKKNKSTGQQDNPPLQVQGNGRGPKIEEKKSKFVGTAFVVTNKAEVRQRVAEVQSELSKATHNAWAARVLVGGEVWSDGSDDGEVSGCAGKPILYFLEMANIVNTLVVVTRYYGGIHLGPAGLVKMYSSTAKDIVERIGTIPLK